MLSACTKDGGNKRKAGEKVDWRIDKDHRRGFYSHLYKYERGDREDEDSGAHPLVHAAWRLLAIAYQETHPKEVAEAWHTQYMELLHQEEESFEVERLDGTNYLYPN